MMILIYYSKIKFASVLESFVLQSLNVIVSVYEHRHKKICSMSMRTTKELTCLRMRSLMRIFVVRRLDNIISQFLICQK